ncbi:hypothetical protein BgAZ_107710 [Babesia gibsoni]|uniref:Uncharacterized protein n=1 Tax=Babesia gibsoni TaxID=33632 RepID=A0AAD8USB8_BABGI|nr:hypothetical protein BgAZ_107710 [Babesia gibsoni]
MMYIPVLPRFARLVTRRHFSSISYPWERSNSVMELIESVKSASIAGHAYKESMERKAMELLSGDMKEAAMLIITLHNFGCNASSLLEKIKIKGKGEHLDLLFRALSECGITAPPDAEVEIMYAAQTADHPLQVYNYICGIGSYTSTKVIDSLPFLLKRMEEIGISNFTPLQILQIAGGVAYVDANSHSGLLNKLCTDLVERGLSNITMPDLLDGMAKLSRNYQCTRLLSEFEKELLSHISSSSLNPEEICQAVYIFSRYHRSNNLVMDRIAVNLRRDIGNYDLDKLSRIVLGLSKIGYYNKAIVDLCGRMVRTFLDKDSTADVMLLTNLYTGFSRFLYHEKIFDIFSEILRKEEVFANLQIHDAVAIVRAYARVHLVDERLFTMLDNKVFSQPMNSDLSMKLLVAHGKLRYRNPRLQNSLLNNINLKEVESQIEREKLKLATERLCLFYPEITDEPDMELPRITWQKFEPVRRRMQHIRRRKWTW